MTIDTFYEVLGYVIDTDKELRLQSGMELISTSLASLVQTPALPTTQQSLANALEIFDKAWDKLAEEFTPSDREAISEMGGAEFFDPRVAINIRTRVGSNAMTPSVASTYVSDLVTRRASFLATVKQTYNGLGALGVSGREAKPGTADVAFVIPREIFGNELDSFAKELVFIDRLIRDVSEATTGTAEVAVLEGLSSSTPTVAILAGLVVIDKIANAVKAFLDVWKKVQEIREARTNLIKLGLSGLALEELTQRATTIVEEVVESTTTTTLNGFTGDSGRRNELETAIRQDARRLFGQIERGLVVQFRAEPSEDADSTEQAALQNIDHLARTLEFPEVEVTPMLLTDGQVLEGEVFRITVTKTSKKTTTSKTGTSAKKDK